MSVVEDLLSDGQAGLLLGQSAAFEGAGFGDEDARAAAARIAERPDAAVFHLLMALRREAPDAYREIPAEARAEALTAALRDLPELNDFGGMEPDGHGHDGPAAQALLELRDAARGPLTELLGDTRPAPLAGSEAATMARTYGYRRCDYAYRYLCKLLGRDARFAAAVADRDRAIAELQ